MKRSNRLVLLIGALLAVVAFVGIVLLANPNGGGPGASASPTPPTTATVVKAQVNMAAGTTVTAEMVTLSTVAIEAVNGNSLRDTGLAIGQTVRRPVTAGAQLTADYFIDLGSPNNVTDALPKGLRAIGVQVSQLTGVGTLIHTGDTVDAIISIKIQNFSSGNAPSPIGAPQPTVKMILQNVKVIGTIIGTVGAAPVAASQAPAASGAPTPVPVQPGVTLNGQLELVILAVTADQAEALRYTQLYDDPTADGISLVLRSPQDYIATDANGSPIPGASPVVPPIEKTDGMILKILIDKYGVLPPGLQ